MTYRHYKYFSTVFLNGLFETVIQKGENCSTIETICSYIFDINQDWYSIEEFDGAVNLIYRSPPFHNVWLDE